MWVKKSNDHRGIKIQKIEEFDLNASGTFVQEYVDKPFLVSKRKFDIGVYVTLTSINPLRLYIYEKDALLRFCENDYYPFNASNIHSYVFLLLFQRILVQPFVVGHFLLLSHRFGCFLHQIDGLFLLTFASATYRYVVDDHYTPIWEIEDLKRYYVDANMNMKEAINAYMRYKDLDPDKMWTQIEQSIKSVYIAKEQQMDRLSNMLRFDKK